MIIDKIIIKNLGFAYDIPYKVIFDGIDLEIDDTWKTVIVGKNGRGKTTLLDLIRGKLKNHSGTISFDKNYSYFPFEVENHDLKLMDLIKDIIGPFREYEKEIEFLLKEGSEKSLELYGELEEKYRILGGYEIESLIEKEFFHLDLGPSHLKMPYSTLSGGEKTKVKLLSLFLKKDSFPLLDEPTNHLDILARKTVAKYLKDKKSGFICISHDSKFLDEIGDHIIDIDDKRGIKLRKAKFSDYFRDRENLEISEKDQNNRLKLEINKKMESFREKTDWSFEAEDKKSGAFDKGFMGAKAARLMKKAKNLEKRLNNDIQEKKSLVQNFEKEYELKFNIEGKLPKELLRVVDLEILYNKRQVVSKLNFNICHGERVAIVGANGSGKTSILRAIINKEKSIYFGNGVKTSYIMQELSYEEKTLKDYLYDLGIDDKEFGRVLASFDLRGEVLNRSLLDFSGGEKRKIALAISIFSKSNFYIWDEPLNFLDFNEIQKLQRAILQYKPTILFVEHDENFVNTVATRIIKL